MPNKYLAKLSKAFLNCWALTDPLKKCSCFISKLTSTLDATTTAAATTTTTTTLDARHVMGK